MSAVHFCIDMQSGGSRYFLPEEWSALTRNTAQLQRRLTGLGIPTVHVLMVNAHAEAPNTSITPQMGRRAEVFSAMRAAGLDICRHDDYQPVHPGAAHDVTVVKTECSVARIPAVREYLRARQADTIVLSGVFEARIQTGLRKAVSVFPPEISPDLVIRWPLSPKRQTAMSIGRCHW